MTRLAFIDCETTGLDPERHEIWEVALSLRDLLGAVYEARGRFTWQLPVDLGKADPMALNVGHFAERRWSPYVADKWDAPLPTALMNGVAKEVWPEDRMDEWCALFARLTWGAHLIGAVPSFDEKRLERLLRQHHACPGWHYHVIDVEALAVGYLSRATTVELPYKSEDLSKLLGIDPESFAKHTAMGDVEWAEAMYDAVMNPRPQESL